MKPDETPYIIAISAIIGAIRPLLLFVTLNHHLSQSYQALAHFWLGMLAAGWYIESDPLCKKSFLILTAVEVVCAAWMIYQKING